MMNSTRQRLVGLTILAAAAACTTIAPKSPMSFFVSSVGPGRGADLGGIEGADRYCQGLADAAGRSGRTWHAYLSTTAIGSIPAINARDRIGAGPWRNYKGDMIADSVADLHGPGNKLTKQTALSEKGTIINGRGDNPNQHDVLTGTTPDGRATAMTCNNWTSGAEGSAIVGHSDRTGLTDTPEARSWNSSHQSKDCSQPGLVSTGGAGLLYCFAVD